MTRVTLVSYDDEPPQGGQGVEVRGMRRELSARGHSVTTVAGRGDHALRYPRVTGRAPLDFSLHLNRHPRLLCTDTADVVHALGGPGGVLLLRQLPVPLVYTANHTYRMAHGPGSLRRALSPLEAHAYRGAAMVLAISASTADAVRALGVASRRIEVLPPGVDVPEGPLPGRDPGRLLFAGRWEPEKGVLDAIAVMRDVLAARPGATAVVLGGGSLEAQVRRFAATVPGIKVAGRVGEGRLAAEYARAAVVLVPSHYEGLGLVALEAQAHGAAVAGYDVAGLRDAVPERDLLVTPGDTAALTDLCLRLIDEPQRREEVSQRARSWVRTAHSWESVARRLEEVYATVLGAS
jgi:glycosyltransferase involved in cell wall biosynthesis